MCIEVAELGTDALASQFIPELSTAEALLAVISKSSIAMALGGRFMSKVMLPRARLHHNIELCTGADLGGGRGGQGPPPPMDTHIP